jgi:hypothetical protein
MKRAPPFFVGYLPVPRALRAFLWLVSVALTIGAGALGYAIGSNQDDPGPGAYRFDWGRQTVTGVIELTPEPVLRVTRGNDRIATGRALVMSAGGKAGVLKRAAPLEGRLVIASGVLLDRAGFDLLQLRGGTNGLRAVAGGEVPELGSQSLGRWKLVGEISDGKCLAGAMRPGRGLAHKACANLCLIGGTPPIFYTEQPIEGARALLIVGPDGTEMPARLYDYVAQYVSIEGEVTRRGDLLLLSVDPDTLEVLE